MHHGQMQGLWQEDEKRWMASTCIDILQGIKRFFSQHDLCWLMYPACMSGNKRVDARLYRAKISEWDELRRPSKIEGIIQKKVS